MITETYYAVRIGKTPNNAPYLMVTRSKGLNRPLVPMLFSNKATVENYLEGRPERKVVRVKITFAGR